ncbi:hypothetical protein QO179_24065 [Bacillus stercoris]|nr:hypothetical protein [Bacillus stercoris]
MGYIIVNGVKYEGKNVQINNNNIVIDGKVISSEASGHVQLEVKGNIGNLTVTGSATINGNVNGYVDAGGSVTCGNVSGSVDAGGSVKAKNVGGDIDAGGSVHIR